MKVVEQPAVLHPASLQPDDQWGSLPLEPLARQSGMIPTVPTNPPLLRFTHMLVSEQAASRALPRDRERAEESARRIGGALDAENGLPLAAASFARARAQICSQPASQVAVQPLLTPATPVAAQPVLTPASTPLVAQPARVPLLSEICEKSESRGCKIEQHHVAASGKKLTPDQSLELKNKLMKSKTTTTVACG